MERVLFVEGVFPDFSLLKEVLLPPCLEVDPPKKINVEDQYPKAQTKTLHFRGQPLDVSIEQKSNCNSLDCLTNRTQIEEATADELQYCKVTGRGRLKSTRNRSLKGEAHIWHPVGGHFHNSQSYGDKMTLLMQNPQPKMIYFMQESAKLLSKVENKDRDSIPTLAIDTHLPLDNVAEENNPQQLNYSRKCPNDSAVGKCCLSQNNNAMELLNLISKKCTILGNAERGHNSKIVVDKKLNSCEVGPELKSEQTTLLDEVILTSSNVPQAKVKALKCVNPNNRRCQSKLTKMLPVPKRDTSSTSQEVLVVLRDNGHSEEKEKVYHRDVCVRKTPRKQKTPTKSVEKVDPSFQGIEFQLHLAFKQKTYEECPLLVTSFYSRGKSRKGSVKSKRRFNSTSLSSNSDDDHTSTFTSKNKRCASCKTQKTPLWRDAEDGTPLCNACGIRYKKYKVRCCYCWTIPKKDGKSYSRYCDCGGMFNVQI